jgi:DNA-binding MarR family transcriptional regulator
MTIVPKEEVSADILQDSVLAYIAAAYFSVGRKLERKTQCSATRGFILSALRGGAVLNQNQIATRLGLDRTVVHRAVKTMAEEGLISERKAKTGKAIHLQLTAKGSNYRERLIRERRSADEAVRRQMSPEEQETLMRLLKQVAECEI